MATKKTSRRPKPTVVPGEVVLIGLPGISMPGDWWIAKVLWTDGAEVLVQQYGIGGSNTHNQLHDLSYVRAVGSHSILREFQDRCRLEVKLLHDRVGEAENALTQARDDVWAKLDQIGAAVCRRAPGGGEVDPT